MLTGFDPRAKLLIAFLFSIITVLTNNKPGLGACLVTGLAGFALSGLTWRRLAPRLAAVNFFLILTWLTLPWQLTGGYPHFYPPGAWLALLITVKANAIFLLWMSLLAGSPASDLLHALAHFHLPDKLLALFFLFERYIYLLSDEYRRLRAAMDVRGFQPRLNQRTLRVFSQLAGAILVRGFDRSQRVYQAMLCRGFKGTFYLISHFHWSGRDSRLLLASLLWLSALLGWEIFA
ncbi:MAG: cobalt ECF transporter T component CbiQ [Desulfarculales bacterium]|jgi:cobalt/nickel transport system permease protein|nr:cobalt ECF transporter T component CbiQ [Desulfarculales bacterium]